MEEREIAYPENLGADAPQNEGDPIDSSYETEVIQATRDFKEASSSNHESAIRRVRAAIAAVAAASALSAGQPPEVPGVSAQTPPVATAFSTKDGILEADTSEKNTTTQINSEKDNGTYNFEDSIALNELIIAHNGRKNIITLEGFITTKDGAPTPSYGDAHEAIANIAQLIKDCPENLRAQLAQDPVVLKSLSVLQETNFHVGVPKERQYESDKLTKEARAVAYQSFLALEGDFVKGVSRLLRERESNALYYAVSILRNHVDIAKDLSFHNLSPSFVLNAARAADKLFVEINPSLQDTREVNQDEVLEVLSAIAYSGNIHAQRIIGERIMKGDALSKNETRRTIEELFLEDRGKEPELFGDIERLKSMGHGGKAVAKVILERAGLDAAEFETLWSDVGRTSSTPKESTMELNSTRFENIERIAQVEKKIPGGMKRLADMYGIRFPGRYLPELLIDQLKYENTRGKYGLILTAYGDHNGAFNFNRNVDAKSAYYDAKDKHIHTVAIEAGTKEQVSTRFTKMLDSYGKVEYMIIRGHGEPSEVSLGQESLDANFLGIGPNRTSLLLKDGAPLLFASCSTGTESGIAQTISKTISGEVTAPAQPTFVESLRLDQGAKGNLVFKAKYHEGENGLPVLRVYRAGETTKDSPQNIPSTKG